ncbi:MAG TPA: hypothetical protein VF865_11725 [Acidobacteriaceae bacterium]
MLPLVLAAIAFLFMLVGAVVFVICVLLPPLRRYALSAALWCAMWGPSSIAFLLLAGTAVVAGVFITKTGDVASLPASRLFAALGRSYLIVAALGAAAIATAAAWLHQALAHRLTFPMFRIYAALVCAGIGSVFGCCLGWLMAWAGIQHSFAWWIMGMLILVLGFGTAAYKGARSLRGTPPTNFSWISAEEFNGT